MRLSAAVLLTALITTGCDAEMTLHERDKALCESYLTAGAAGSELQLFDFLPIMSHEELADPALSNFTGADRGERNTGRLYRFDARAMVNRVRGGDPRICSVLNEQCFCYRERLREELRERRV